MALLPLYITSLALRKRAVLNMRKAACAQRMHCFFGFTSSRGQHDTHTQRGPQTADP
jgi:hypothetical protein